MKTAINANLGLGIGVLTGVAKKRNSTTQMSSLTVPKMLNKL